MTNQRTVLARIGNIPPATLRELIYSSDDSLQFTRRSQVNRLYKTRGDLIATVFNLYLEGKLQWLTTP